MKGPSFQIFITGTGDSCDSDKDNDGVNDSDDNCFLFPNPDQSDVDSDGKGDACDLDFEGDGCLDENDNCGHNHDICYTDFREIQTIDLCLKNQVKFHMQVFLRHYNLLFNTNLSQVQTADFKPKMSISF